MKKELYKLAPVPKDLTFDEESLFWRLRMGEGLPSRTWHKPLEKEKSWEEIKTSLDQKIAISKKSGKSVVRRLTGKLIKVLKRSFLIAD